MLFSNLLYRMGSYLLDIQDLNYFDFNIVIKVNYRLVQGGF